MRTFLFSLIVACLLTPLTATSQNTGGVWESRAPMSIARQETPLVHLNGKIYHMGGINSAGAAISTLEIYDIASDSWSIGEDLPFTLHHHGGAALNGKVYTTAGYSATQFIESTLLCEYDPGLDIWRQLTPIPRQMGAHATVAYNGELYLFGGTYFNAAFSHAFKYNPTTDTWTELQSLPVDSEHLSAAVVGDKIYVSGGRRRVNFVVTNLSDLHVYTPLTDSWEQKAPMNEARAGHASASVDGRLYVFGGESFSDGAQIIKSVEEYDPVSDTWRLLDDMPKARHGFSAVDVNSQIFLSGGGINAGFSASADTQVFTPPPVATFSAYNAELPRELSVLSIYPNPAARQTTLKIELKMGARITTRLIDILGREVNATVDQFYTAGSHDISIALPVLSSGIYFLALRVNDSRVMREIQIVQ